MYLVKEAAQTKQEQFKYGKVTQQLIHSISCIKLLLKAQLIDLFNWTLAQRNLGHHKLSFLLPQYFRKKSLVYTTKKPG